MIDFSKLVIEDCDRPFWDSRPLPQRRSTWLCANCGQSFAAGRATVYCAPRCRGEAKAVRYGRGKLTKYEVSRVSELPHKERAALQTKLWAAFLGYDERARRLTAPQWRSIHDRDGGRCVRCGRPGQEVDHVVGSSPHLDNLRLLCMACHDAKSLPRQLPRPRSGRVRAYFDRLDSRIESPTPLRPCDTAHWPWHTWATEHAM